MSTAKKSFRNGRKQSGLVWVVVLGDFGRSPRMQYHTVSLATQAGKEVHVLAYGGSQPIQAVGDNQAIVLHTIPEPPAVLQRLPRTISMVLKAVLQTVMLLMLMLRRMPRPAAILLQVPPAIPIMALCWLAARWHRAAFVIDWHNFGFTLMRLSMGRRHVLVRLAERFERFWGRRSDGNITSWTPDEDFSILLEAAQIYDAAVAQGRGGHPKLLIFVTGKGPQKAMYRARMHQLDLRHVAIRTVWLEPEDYPVLLGSADMGVSLHTSSSGLDLPMKVVDMFGCGLPVCAASYSCISELVAHGQNGMLFTTAQELADHWLHLFQGFPASGELQRLRKHVLASGAIGWSDSWGKVVKPLF
ncbi:hypothetical protein WJX72_006458 [[Myrmecia] bisecta]|uniref:Chitobiosyldiphosphodolichol beta-mannosyltransferase n=1 Tax=[Myrmecia] bisecta TaxID=41462 RepID=A0AAW1QFA6_9CHLO